jgi:hypothetical protein
MTKRIVSSYPTTHDGIVVDSDDHTRPHHHDREKKNTNGLRRLSFSQMMMIFRRYFAFLFRFNTNHIHSMFPPKSQKRSFFFSPYVTQVISNKLFFFNVLIYFYYFLILTIYSTIFRMTERVLTSWGQDSIRDEKPTTSTLIPDAS